MRIMSFRTYALGGLVFQTSGALATHFFFYFLFGTDKAGLLGALGGGLLWVGHFAMMGREFERDLELAYEAGRLANEQGMS